MTDRIEYIFLEVPNCSRAFTPEASLLDNLCYVLGHISEMTDRPAGVEGEIFDLLFKSAEIVNFAPRERKEYIKDMTTERDIKNQLAFAENAGIKKGMEQGLLQGRHALEETARNLLKMGLSVEDVSKATGLSVAEIEAL